MIIQIKISIKYFAVKKIELNSSKADEMGINRISFQLVLYNFDDTIKAGFDYKLISI